MTQKLAYKILSEADWQNAQTPGYTMTPLDEGDGFVHLSTREQLEETLTLHYRGAHNVHLLEFAIADLGANVLWEPSRGGQMFPHLYDKLYLARALRHWQLETGSNDVPAIPGEI